MTDLYELLLDLEAFLDDHADVHDGDHGEPRPNLAMSLQARVLREIDRINSTEPLPLPAHAGSSPAATKSPALDDHAEGGAPKALYAGTREER